MRRVFLVPALVALVCVVGLAVALTGDGWRDAVSWAALAAPVAACGWAMRARRR
jgi:hypothetical protein